MTKKQRVQEILEILEKQYPNAKTELEWSKKYPFQLIVAVMLSAQATDAGVNKATKELFKKYKTPKDFAEAKYEDLIKYTKSINYYKTKTERIINAAQALLTLYGGDIPKNINDLVKLPGIGRKSANVILQEVYGIGEGIVVDTHVTRVTYRLGLQPYNNQKDAEKIEAELKKIVPKDKYKLFSRLIVLHGRYVCKAKNPNCESCKIQHLCPSAFKV